MTQAQMTCDGFSNYETCAVALWLQSDHAASRYWREQARQHREDAPTCPMVVDGAWDADEAEKHNLADQLRDEISENAPGIFAAAYSDRLTAALENVHWQEIAEAYLKQVPAVSSFYGPVISAYTRADALSDGVLIDVSAMAREAGLRHPTAVTSAVWAQYVAVPEGVEAQDEQGRLWDILMTLCFAILRDGKGNQLLYDVLVRNNNTSPRRVTLKAVCGPGDSAEPVITIMRPDED
jgi:hypothetical protein